MTAEVLFYRVNTDPDEYQCLWPTDPLWDPLPEQHPERPWQSSRFHVDGSALADTWITPETYVRNPSCPRPNFFMFEHKCGFALDEQAQAVLLPDLLLTGELLPVRLEGEMLAFLNVLVCVDALDPEETEWYHDPDEPPDLEGNAEYRSVDEPRFRLDKLPDSSLFIVPETNGVDIYCYETSTSNGFKKRVETAGLTGLTFELIYTAQGE